VKEKIAICSVIAGDGLANGMAVSLPRPWLFSSAPGLQNEGLEESVLGGREAPRDEHPVVPVLLGLDVPERVELCDDVIAVVRDEQAHRPQAWAIISRQRSSSAPIPSPVRALTRSASGTLCLAARFSSRSARSTLLNTSTTGRSPAPSSASTLSVVARCFSKWGLVMSTTWIGVGDQHLLEGGLEGLHEPVGQAPDEADRVGEEQLLVARQDKLAGRGVEGREELVLGEDLRSGERVQERGLSAFV